MHNIKTFGSCALCMRKAFLLAVTIWLITVIFSYFTDSIFLRIILFFGSIITTIIWITHIVSYTIRLSKYRSQHRTYAPSTTRRSFAFNVANALASAFVITVAPKIAFADGDVCFCKGTNWPPGASACMGGQKTLCVNGGWSSTNEPCDGGESCR